MPRLMQLERLEVCPTPGCDRASANRRRCEGPSRRHAEQQTDVSRGDDPVMFEMESKQPGDRNCSPTGEALRINQAGSLIPRSLDV
jgi:hypothetical protein